MNSTKLPASSEPKLNEHLQDIRRDVGNLAQDVKNHATDQFNDIKDQAVVRLKDTQKQAAAQIDNAKRSANELLESSRAFLSEHPFTAVGVGVVVGILLASRWRKND